MRKENTMDELISRQVLLDKFEKWQKTEDYSNDEWNLLVDVLSVIKSMPPAPQLSTNLAEVGTDLARTVKGFPIDADMLMLKVEEEYGFRARDRLYGIIRNMPKYELPSAQPEIIRCKDCKYARLTNDGSCKYCDIWFPDEAEYMDGDYYCASAERKSNG